MPNTHVGDTECQVCQGLLLLQQQRRTVLRTELEICLPVDASLWPQQHISWTLL